MSLPWGTSEFNRFRETYSQLSFQDKKATYLELYEAFPFQARFLSDLGFILEALPKQRNVKVVEYGGYDGFLASIILYRNPTWTWTNIELIRHKPHWFTKDKNYEEVVLETELWHSNIKFDAGVFLAENTIEHLADAEFTKLVEWVNQQDFSTVIFSAPLEENGQTWHDYFGAHVLTLGSRQVTELMKPKYRLVKENRGKGWIAHFDNHS